MSYYDDLDLYGTDDYGDEYSDEMVEVLKCHECNNEFEAEPDSDPERCPICGIEFD